LLLKFAFQLVPDPLVKVYAPSNQRVSQSLTLECNVTTVRGITSRVDLVWSSTHSELERIEGIDPSSTESNSVTYKDSYTISQLGTVDENRTYQCEIIINTALPITVNDSITLDVSSEFYILFSFSFVFCCL